MFLESAEEHTHGLPGQARATAPEEGGYRKTVVKSKEARRSIRKQSFLVWDPVVEWWIGLKSGGTALGHDQGSRIQGVKKDRKSLSKASTRGVRPPTAG